MHDQTAMAQASFIQKTETPEIEHSTIADSRQQLLEEAQAVLRKRVVDLYMRLEHAVLRPESTVSEKDAVTAVDTPLSPFCDRIRAAQRQAEETTAVIEEILDRLEV